MQVLAGLYGSDAGKYPRYLRCLIARLGRPEGSPWGAEAHAALYAEASSVINFRAEGESSAAMRAEPFGFNPARAGRIAGNLPTMKFEAEDAFWSCLGVDRATAVASINAKSGPYWTMAVAAATAVTALEGGRRRPRGSIVASLLTLGIGSAAALWAGGE